VCVRARARVRACMRACVRARTSFNNYNIYYCITIFLYVLNIKNWSKSKVIYILEF